MENEFDCFVYDNSTENIKKIFASEKTKIVLDTSVLLELYEYPYTIQSTLLDVLHKYENKISIPYHVAVEFFKNRNSVILKKNKKKKLDEKTEGIYRAIDAIATDFKFNSYKKKEYKEINEILEGVPERIKKVAEAVKKEIESILKTQESQYIVDLAEGKDEILEKINVYFIKNIWKPLYEEDEKFEELQKKCKEENEQGLGAGFKDKDKSSSFLFNGIKYESCAGDYIIFEEIKKHAKEAELTNIVFITNDNKEDWGTVLDNGDIIPRYELKEEMKKDGGANFYIFNVQSFLTYSKTEEAGSNKETDTNSASPSNSDLNSRIQDAVMELKKIGISKDHKLVDTTKWYREMSALTELREKFDGIYGVDKTDELRSLPKLHTKNGIIYRLDKSKLKNIIGSGGTSGLDAIEEMGDNIFGSPKLDKELLNLYEKLGMVGYIDKLKKWQNVCIEIKESKNTYVYFRKNLAEITIESLKEAVVLINVMSPEDFKAIFSSYANKKDTLSALRSVQSKIQSDLNFLQRYYGDS